MLYVMLYVICYMLYVICYMLYVICYILYIILVSRLFLQVLWKHSNLRPLEVKRPSSQIIGARHYTPLGNAWEIT